MGIIRCLFSVLIFMWALFTIIIVFVNPNEFGNFFTIYRFHISDKSVIIGT